MAKVDPRVLSALRLSVEAHADQLRKDGRTPYVVHPIGVMRRLSTELGVVDPDLLAAALLHDVLEDTEVPPERIREELNPRVLRHVEELTLPEDAHGPSVATATKTRHLVEALRTVSWESVAIKLCDRWDNLSDAFAAPWSRSKTEGFFEQTEEMLRAVAERRRVAPEPPSWTEALDRGVRGVEDALREARARRAGA